MLLLIWILLAFALRASATQCPHRPFGRLQENIARTCPVPGRIGIIEDKNNVISWEYQPKCFRQENETQINCLFTSTNFRNGHGISLVTSTTVASHLVGLGAFEDSPRRHSQPAYDIVPMEGKGLGVVATRKIRRGEIIIVDMPAVLIGISFLTTTKPHHRRRIIKQAFNQLRAETKNQIYGLHQAGSPYQVDAILGPNAHTVMLADEVHVGLFTQLARINHACRPNAYYRFSERRLTLEVLAYRTIQPGEEITISYVPLEMPVDERKKYLKDHWGFDCRCELCRSSQSELEDSESWRRRMKSLKNTILSAKNEGFFHDAIVMAEEWLQFAEWEMVPPLEPEYHDMLAELHRLNGDRVNATKYARMAVDGWARLGSVDDEPLEKARVFLEQLSNGKGI